MTHEEFKEKLLKAMGGKPPVSARETWGNFQRERSMEFYMNYDWVVEPKFWAWAISCPDITTGLGGTQGTSIWVLRQGRVGHDN